MEGQERISVIVPVYNGAATLAGCLDAVYASQYPDFEVVVVDDGSKDATREVAARYPCRVLALPQNQGAAQAKNEGARPATGEILFFTDADVHVQPQTLSWVAEALRDAEVAGVVGLLAESCPHPNFASQFKNLWMHFTYRRQPRRVGLFFTSAAAIRRSIFVQEGGFDVHYRGASITEDIEFGQRLLSRGYQIVMDQRLTVEHDKHYTVGEVLRTDLLRARGLTQTWIRNRITPEKRAHYASVPWFFGAGVLFMGLATICLLFALVFGSARILLGAVGLVLVALALNGPFLLALGRWRGLLFLLQSAGFILVDLYASGLGVALGFCDFVRGRRY
jgi:glycosyltransferase involved in cell wall biosynthesis